MPSPDSPRRRAGADDDVDATAAPTRPANDAETWTVDDLAAHLRLHPKTVYAEIRRQNIPGVRRIGRAVRIHRATVIAWLAEGQGRVPRSRRSG